MMDIKAVKDLHGENDIKQMFQDDVREKKRIGIGIYSKTGSRGHTGRINMPTDFMNKKDKKEYIKPSKVRITFMHKTIMPFEQFQSMPQEDQRKMLILYRKAHSTKDIKNAWLINGEPMLDYQYYTMMKKLGISSQRPSNSPEKEQREEKVMEKQSSTEMVPIPTYAKAPALAIGMNGEFISEEIVSRLMKFAALLENEPGKFNIQLLIEFEK